jgi:hypothetical protein
LNLLFPAFGNKKGRERGESVAAFSVYLFISVFFWSGKKYLIKLSQFNPTSKTKSNHLNVEFFQNRFNYTAFSLYFCLFWSGKNI